MTSKHAEHLILGTLAAIIGFITFFIAYQIIWTLTSHMTLIPPSSQWLLTVYAFSIKVALCQLLILPLMIVPRWRLPHFLIGLLGMLILLTATSVDFIQSYPKRSWVVLLSSAIAFLATILTALRLKKSRLYD